MDENTALIVTDVGTPNVRMTVLGQSGVFIFDLTGAHKRDQLYGSIYNVSTTYITEVQIS